MRRQRNKPEDFRYKTLHKRWGSSYYPRLYLQVFLGQGILALVVASPVVIIATLGDQSLTGLELIGWGVWLVGYLIESRADRELASFVARRSSKTTVMDKGLWHFSRHPNYFGEITQWWGLGIVALSVPFGWVGLIGPLTISILIIWVSGVPLVEKKLRKNPAYRTYAARTSQLIPWPPRLHKSKS